MRTKLTLALDALDVQSFETGTDASPLRGTVHAREETTLPCTGQLTCPPEDHSGEPCVYTLLTACPPECGV